MSRPITLGLVGIGGWGRHVLAGVLDAKPAAGVSLVAAVEPFPDSCPRFSDVVARGVPVYETIDDLYAAGHRPQLVVISSPIQMHCEQTVTALRHGSHVLCEKPVAATMDQVREMIAARDRAKRIVAIGYQWCFAGNVHELKHDIASGMFGAPRRLATFVGWPRDQRYFTRNAWAGRQYDEAGRPVFDSPVNNACAHYLQNMLVLLGGDLCRSAEPQSVSAELFRANEIENYDTAAIRCVMEGGVEVYFYVTHAIPRVNGPVFRYEFENAVVDFDDASGEGIVARFKDGQTRRYGIPAVGIGKLWTTIDDIRTGRDTCCGLQAAAAQTMVVEAAQRFPITPFPRSLVRVTESEEGSPLRVVDGLEKGLLQCFREHKLPSEIGFEWAKPRKAKALT